MIGALALADLPAEFDLVVVGGGITGAGVAAEAARTGAAVLLVEAHDFASGASSKSSKLVHGGLRYLAQGQFHLTFESVRERNRLLAWRPGLVETQPFLMPVYAGSKPGLAALRAALAVYDLMGSSWSSRRLDARHTLALEPTLRSAGLRGAVYYDDAQTDDARLVLHLVQEAVAAGALALNYTRLVAVLSQAGRVRGVALADEDGATREIGAGLVVWAAGAMGTRVPGAPAGAPQLRPLRGSHLLFPFEKLPLRHAVGWWHPRDGRPIFAYPWQGATLYGTTDVDHPAGAGNPVMAPDESDYLLEGLRWQFPDHAPGLDEALSSYSGIRPVVAGGADSPSAESRESALWQAPGWIGVTGGKLTTFRLTARQVLRRAARLQPRLAPPRLPGPSPAARERAGARYGADYAAWLAQRPAAEQAAIAATAYRWAELRWAAQHEWVRHLDDLLLRRTRLGLLLPQGGRDCLPHIETLCRDALGWDSAHWQSECARYQRIWRAEHAPRPAGAGA